MTSGYIYLVWANGTDKYKIGSSAYPERRVKALQTGSPIPLSLIAVKEVENAEMEERKLHKLWDKHRSQGEWFTFHPVKVPEILSFFGRIDPWTSKQFKDLDEKAAEIFQSVLEKIDKAHSDNLAIIESVGRKDLDLVGQKAYESTWHLLDLLSQHLPKEETLKISDSCRRFDHELDLISFNIEVDF
jgi:hypothetical protein